MRASELLWRKVQDTEGRSIGRVYDLIGERRGEELRVTGLLVGKNNLWVRFGWSAGHGQDISWQQIVRLDPEIVVQAEGAPR